MSQLCVMSLEPLTSCRTVSYRTSSHPWGPQVGGSIFQLSFGWGFTFLSIVNYISFKQRTMLLDLVGEGLVCECGSAQLKRGFPQATRIRRSNGLMSSCGTFPCKSRMLTCCYPLSWNPSPATIHLVYLRFERSCGGSLNFSELGVKHLTVSLI